METIYKRLEDADWETAGEQMNRQGYTQLNGILSMQECEELKALYTREDLYRKTITMERYRFGKGNTNISVMLYPH